MGKRVILIHHGAPVRLYDAVQARCFRRLLDGLFGQPTE